MLTSARRSSRFGVVRASRVYFLSSFFGLVNIIPRATNAMAVHGIGRVACARTTVIASKVVIIFLSSYD